VTCSTPFMPSSAWESTVQRYGYVPLFSVTDIVVDWPGPMVLDVWPAIAKSCSVAPMF